ncbi:GDSL-type esterase/lipase family protein [Bacteroides faecalis]|nr:GDSL-type esterase/lipase family protein [Bacteroides faecalis]
MMNRIISLLLLIFTCYMPTQGLAQEKIKIACIGNSITEGPDNYPTPLAKMLGDKYEIGNFGKWGHTLLRKGDHPYMSTEAFVNAQKFQPDIVIIKLGTNDSKPENWEYKDEFQLDLEYMVRTFKHCGSKPKIILCRCIPAGNNLYGIRNDVITKEIYPIQRKVAKKFHLKLVDLYTPFEQKVDSTYYVWDNVHLNKKGSCILAGYIYRAITGKKFTK